MKELAAGARDDDDPEPEQPIEELQTKRGDIDVNPAVKKLLDMKHR